MNKENKYTFQQHEDPPARPGSGQRLPRGGARGGDRDLQNQQREAPGGQLPVQLQGDVPEARRPPPQERQVLRQGPPELQRDVCQRRQARGDEGGGDLHPRRAAVRRECGQQLPSEGQGGVPTGLSLQVSVGTVGILL